MNSKKIIFIKSHHEDCNLVEETLKQNKIDFLQFISNSYSDPVIINSSLAYGEYSGLNEIKEFFNTYNHN